MSEQALQTAERRSRRPTARYAERREKIIDIASALLNEKGVWGMTLLEVAQALELTTTSVTYYYRYKEQLAVAAFEDTMDRLDAMTAEAARENTPRERVRRYIGIYFEQYASSLCGAGRPLVMLSELRALEGETRLRLIARYQTVFRNTRALFGPVDTAERKRAHTASTQVLNEALFWATIWLRRYPVSAFAKVADRLFGILEHGIAAPGTVWGGRSLCHEMEAAGDAKQEYLRVATRLINDIGYRGASVERIVKQMNTTKGRFYHHLDDKNGLILDCFRDSYKRLSMIQHRIEGQATTHWQKVADLIASALAMQFVGDDPLLRTTALHAMPPAIRALAIERCERFTWALSGVIADGIADGSVRPIDPMIAAQVTLSTMNSAYDLRGWAGRQSAERAIARYGTTLMSGIFSL